MIPMEAATEAGVLVANVPGVNARTVAEHVVCGPPWRCCGSSAASTATCGRRAGSPGATMPIDGNDLSGRTHRHRRLGRGRPRMSPTWRRKGFGLDVVVNSRTAKDLPDHVRFASIDELVEASDIVVLCCPLTPETTGLIGPDRIARMKPGALLINVSRGPVVDDAALVEALSSGHVGGAALDVFATQPLPPDHPYFSFDNVIITPHMAGITEESMMRMGIGAAEEAIRVLAGELPLNLRNPEVVEHYRRRFP